MTTVSFSKAETDKKLSIFGKVLATFRHNNHSRIFLSIVSDLISYILVFVLLKRNFYINILLSTFTFLTFLALGVLLCCPLPKDFIKKIYVIRSPMSLVMAFIVIDHFLPNEAFYLNITLILIGNMFNNMELKSGFYQKCLIAYFLFSVASAISKNDSTESMIVYLIISSLVVIVYLIQKATFDFFGTTIHSQKVKLESLENFNGLTSHDINNNLHQILITIEVAFMHKEISQGVYEKCTSVLMEIKDKIKWLQAQEAQSEFEMRPIVEHICRKNKARYEITGNGVVTYSYPLFYSLVHNLISNAQEAHTELNRQENIKNPEPFFIHVEIEDNHLRVTDNAGGFDVTRIAKGISTKKHKDEHGLFLHYLVNTEIFRVKTEIVRKHTGTQFILNFKMP